MRPSHLVVRLSYCDPEHPERVQACLDLAGHLMSRFTETDDVSITDEAITLGRETLLLYPPGHLERARACQHLA
jgi:hypothetical protein